MDGRTEFPAVEEALKEPDGLLAFGGDLKSKTLINAYSKGIFPWFSEQEPILWWCPNPRMVLFPQKLHVSRSFKRALKKTNYKVYWNRDFDAVINGCAMTRKDGLGTWITADMKKAYKSLHQKKIVHCLEIDIDGQLAGGIYGVALDRIFYGESMFSLQTNGSKFALYELCKHLLDNNYRILDCQAHNDHLQSMGAELIPIREFKKYLPRKSKLKY
ncbi:MAG TPA: leucyl/phenylalanyl-tRNA--protein transferase [Oceanospirillales bacterium]|nr:leucyl/phenylalanyl-tRNA--protein transferase [Oceanospirillales bacterium]